LKKKVAPPSRTIEASVSEPEMVRDLLRCSIAVATTISPLHKFVIPTAVSERAHSPARE